MTTTDLIISFILILVMGRLKVADSRAFLLQFGTMLAIIVVLIVGLVYVVNRPA